MAGMYCIYCNDRCFVTRQIITDGAVIWHGHMATCGRGMQHDYDRCGYTYQTAHNPFAEV